MYIPSHYTCASVVWFKTINIDNSIMCCLVLFDIFSFRWVPIKNNDWFWIRHHIKVGMSVIVEILVSVNCALNHRYILVCVNAVYMGI